MVKTIIAKDIMDNKYKKVYEDQFLSEILPLFDTSTDVVLVFDKQDKYKGIITERDILRSGLKREKTKAKAIVNTAPKITRNHKITECARLMIENDVMNLPVFDGKKVVGVINDSALLNSVALKEFGNRKASEFMTEDMIIVSPEDKISTVLRMFREFHISRLPVIEYGNLIGIITLHDIIEKFMLSSDFVGDKFVLDEKNSLFDLSVVDIMTANVITVKPDEPVKKVINLMINNLINSVLVVDNNDKLIGIISRKDLLRPISEINRDPKLSRLQISSKIEDLDKPLIESIISKFVKKIEPRIKNPFIYLHLKKHKEIQNGECLIYANLRLHSPGNKISVNAEGWGVENTVKNAVLKIEKKLRKKLAPKTISEKRKFMEYVEIESLT